MGEKKYDYYTGFGDPKVGRDPPDEKRCFKCISFKKILIENMIEKTDLTYTKLSVCNLL